MNLQERLDSLAKQRLEQIVLDNAPSDGPVLDEFTPQLGLSPLRSLLAYWMMSHVQRWQIDGDVGVRLTEGASENLTEHGIDMKLVALEWLWDSEALNQDLDREHVLELCDSHDIGEVGPGDLPLGETDSLRNAVRRKIHKGVERVFAERILLPLLDPSKALRDNYSKYEDRGLDFDKKNEHFVKAVDCYVALRKALSFLYSPENYNEVEKAKVTQIIQDSWEKALDHVELFLEAFNKEEVQEYLLKGKFKQLFDTYKTMWPELVWPYSN